MTSFLTRPFTLQSSRRLAYYLGRCSFSNKTIYLDDHDFSDHDDDDQELRHKRLDVAIVGYPNAGKSQLLNSLVGTKVAAVSRKRHTTRDGILGVKTEGDTQLVFCDTPGFLHDPESNFGKDLVRTAKAHMTNVDYSLVVIDAAKTKLTDDYLNTLSTLLWNALHSKTGQFGIVLNKVDLVQPKRKLLDAAERFGHMADVLILEQLKLHNPHLSTTTTTPPPSLLPEIFYTCAKQGPNDPGIIDLKHYLLQRAIPRREWILPDAHSVTPMDLKARVEELIREKIYRILHREVPHSIQQRNRQFQYVKGEVSSVVMIHQDLLVSTKSHLRLLQSGQLQRVQEAAVPELRNLFRCEVLLTLNVKLIAK